MTPDHEPDALSEQDQPYAMPPESQRLFDEMYRYLVSNPLKTSGNH